MNTSSETRSIAIPPQELHIVQCLLRAYLPANAKVWVFGSRAGGTLRRGSDLDLAIDAGERLELGIMGSLNDTLDIAPLAYNVDLVDFHSVSPEFRALIDAHKIALPGFE